MGLAVRLVNVSRGRRPRPSGGLARDWCRAAINGRSQVHSVSLGAVKLSIVSASARLHVLAPPYHLLAIVAMQASHRAFLVRAFHDQVVDALNR